MGTIIVFKAKDKKRLARKYRPGMKLIIQQRRKEDGFIRMESVTVTVKKTFPHFLSCVTDKGIRVSLDYFDLEQERCEEVKKKR